MEVEEQNAEDLIEQERIIELAQLQEMALLQLDEVVQNQQNLRDRINEENELLLAAETNQEDGDEDEHEQRPQQQLPMQNNARPTHDARPNNHHARQGGERRHPCSVTQLYFILSVSLAFLAVFAAPTNLMFHVSITDPPKASTGTTEVIETSAVVDDKANRPNMEDVSGAVLDNHGNIVERVASSWEAVVAHSYKTKYPSSDEPSKQKTESQLDPPTPSPPLSWSESVTKFAGEAQDYFTLLYRMKMHMRLVYDNSTIADVPPKAIKAADAKQSSSSSRWLPPWEWMKQKQTNRTEGDTKQPDSSTDEQVESNEHKGGISNIKIHSLLYPILRVFDPSITKYTITNTTVIPSRVKDTVEATPDSAKTRSTFMTVIDKVFASTPRLIAVANLLLALTYLLQTAVADIFLGPIEGLATDRNGAPLRRVDRVRRRRTGCDRFGGFLCFKLLLISAVIEPDSADLFILLSWYTLLSFLRSLSHLAGSTATHSSQSGEPPSPGALRLLILVLVCDTVAVAGCITLLYNTSWNLVCLLSSDCMLLAVEVTVHIGRYAIAKVEEMHRIQISYLEDRQAEIHAQRREQMRDANSDLSESSGSNGAVQDENLPGHDEGGDNEEAYGEIHSDQATNDALEEQLRELVRIVEEVEAEQSERLNSMDTICFVLEIFALLLTMFHFLHIWALHGASFGLIDGVLALHIHSTISMIGKKIAERRNVRRIAQDLDNQFPDAAEKDIRNASAAGDVCCICLNSMTVGGVKKVACGHLFHTNCLKEVVERERSIASAKCPLCRASLVTGRHDHNVARGGVRNDMRNNNGPNDTTNNEDAAGAGVDNRQMQPAQPVQPANPQFGPGEQSLFRFSTAGFMPAWLPIPAFAFEVVRRDATAVVEPNPNTDGPRWQRFFRRGGAETPVIQGINGGRDNNEHNNDNSNNDNSNNEANDGDQAQPEVQQEPETEPGFWRRLLVLLGAIPMTPEEEAAALEQLVDMFPQYDRADLLRELRSRRSAEAVAESILLGIFSGIPRGGGGD